MCGTTPLVERAYCFTKGSKCEERYKANKFFRHAKKSGNNEANNDISDVDVNTRHGGPGRPAQQGQCGVPQGPKKSVSSWALRIIGKNYLLETFF